MILSIPGKTFLVGEYLALAGGPSIVVCTGPRFRLRVRALPAASSSGGADPERSRERFAPARLAFAPGSPAGRFLAATPIGRLRGLSFRFEDPHSGAGGLGASTAQYALAVAALDGARKLEAGAKCLEYVRRYRDFAWDGQGRAPSGADVVAQMTGGVTFFDGRDGSLEQMPWNFPRLGFTLVRTGRKLATHEHLRGTREELREETLRPIVEAAKTAIKNVDERGLADAVETYGIRLSESGFLAPETAALLAEIRARDAANGFRLRAAKGCGAMGADVIVLIHDVTGRESLVAWLNSRNLQVCGTDADLSSGLSVDASEEQVMAGERKDDR